MADIDDTSPAIPSPHPTPIPSTPNELAIVVAKIDDRTRLMIERYLPRVEETALEARDGVMELKGRVSHLEATPEHECDEKERQRRQDEGIQKSKVSSITAEGDIKGLHTFRNWLIGIIVLVVGSAGGFAVHSSTADTSHDERLDATRSDVDRHENIIADLPRKADFERINEAVKAIPTEVQKLKAAPATALEVEEAASELPLKPHELEALRTILKRAHGRENGE